MKHLSPLQEKKLWLGRCLPVLVGIGVSALALFLWKALEARQRSQIKGKIEFAAVRVQQEISTQLQNRILSLERMAQRWEIQGGTPKTDWYADAKNYITDYPGFQAIEWVDSTFYIRWIVPLAGNEAAQDLNLAFEKQRLDTLETARQRQSVTVTSTIELVQGGKGFLTYIPIFLSKGEPPTADLNPQSFDGFILGVFRVQELFDTLLNEEVAPGYRIDIFEGDDQIYHRSHLTQPLTSNSGSARSRLSQNRISQRLKTQWGHTTEVDLDGVIWRIRIWPTAALIAEEHSPLPEVVLGGGVLMAALLAWATHLTLTARRQMQRIEGVNQAIAHEVTERQRAEEQRQLSEERLRHLLTTSPAVIYSCRASGDYGATFMSENVTSIFGYESREFTEDSSFWAEHIHPDDAPHVFEELLQIYQQGRHTHEYRFQHKDGTYRWVRDELRLVRDTQGDPLEIVGYWIDLSDRKQAEELLKQKSEALEDFSINLKHLHRINTTDYADFDVLFADCLETGCEILGLETGIISQIINQTYLIRSVKSHLDALAPGLEFALQNTYCATVAKDKQTINYRHVGEIASLQSHPVYQSLKLESYIGTPIFVNGQVFGTLNFSSTQIRSTDFQPHEQEIIELMAKSIGRFITADQAAKEQRRMEEALRASEASYRAIVEDQTELICRFAPDGALTFVNDAYCRYFDRSRADLIGGRFLPLIPSEDREMIRNVIATLDSNQPVRTVEHRVFLPDGEIRWQQWSDRAIFDQQDQLVEYQAVGRDITDRKRAEEALKLRNKQSRLFRRTHAQDPPVITA